MHPATMIPTFLPLLVAVAIRRAEERIYRRFAERSAFTAESAIQLPPGRLLERRRLQSVIRNGAVRPGQNGSYYLDIDAWNAYRSNRRQRVLLVVSALVAILGAAFSVLYFTPWRP